MKVLVIGAGFAGCCAALLLRESLAADVSVLEAGAGAPVPGEGVPYEYGPRVVSVFRGTPDILPFLRRYLDLQERDIYQGTRLRPDYPVVPFPVDLESLKRLPCGARVERGGGGTCDLGQPVRLNRRDAAWGKPQPARGRRLPAGRTTTRRGFSVAGGSHRRGGGTGRHAAPRRGPGPSMAVQSPRPLGRWARPAVWGRADGGGGGGPARGGGGNAAQRSRGGEVTVRRGGGDARGAHGSLPPRSRAHGGPTLPGQPIGASPASSAGRG
ncbi:MAG: NAD(P)-binding protein [Betaproteobacteria bacterium]|nr:NAD(P)-binding protein [Betaproteobacteria bacterium]